MLPNGMPGPPKRASRFSWKVFSAEPEDSTNSSEALTNPEDALVTDAIKARRALETASFSSWVEIKQSFGELMQLSKDNTLS